MAPANSEENVDRATEQRAEEDYQAKLRYTRVLYRRDQMEAKVQASVLRGQNVMRHETGFFGPWDGTRYNFDQATQDLLIAHTREDVSATYGLASEALRQAYRARRMAKAVFWLVALLVVLNTVGLALLVALWVRT